MGMVIVNAALRADTAIGIAFAQSQFFGVDAVAFVFERPSHSIGGPKTNEELHTADRRRAYLWFKWM